jgi:hypothetical protein
MATVNKDFKIKSGLIVEGTSATVNGFDVLTKKQADQDYIVGLIGGTATSANTANTVVKRDADGNFAAGTITATITGTVSSLSNHDTADLAENATNKYFTDARAIAATAASYDVLGAAAAAKTAAEATASADATSKANAAKTAAEATASADATSKANAARTAAETFATNADTAVRTAVTTEIGTAISTEVTNRNSAIASAIATEVTDRNTAIGTAVSNLVDGAPALLDTLNELAFALGDSPDTITNLTTLVGDKAPLASPALTGVPTAPTAAADTNTTQIATTAFAKAEADAAQSAAASDATTKADAAQAAAISAAASDATTKANNAKSGAEATAAADATSKANAAQAAAIAHADALTTSDVAEGTEQYFTDARAKASAAALLTGATKTNITITGTGAGLVITAENGVADSTTSDLAEGSNLYFTNARAVSAVQAVVPNFTSVDLNSVAKQVAATLSAPTAGIQTAHAFAKADYRSAEYLVKVAYGTHTEISKVLLTLDSSDNIAITEYGIVGTNGSASSISAGISGANVQLQVTTTNNNSTVTVMGTLLK